MENKIDPQQDMKQLVQQITEEPDVWEAYADLVLLLSVTDNFMEAEELALKSLGLFESDEEARQHLLYATGNVYYSAGEYGKANEYFEKITDQAVFHDATMMQAQSWYAQNNMKQALVFAITGAEQDDQDVTAFVLLGNIWMALENMSEAEDAFDHALSLQPENFDANFGRGILATLDDNQDNKWLLKASEIGQERYQDHAGRLDDMMKVMLGRQLDE